MTTTMFLLWRRQLVLLLCAAVVFPVVAHAQWKGDGTQRSEGYIPMMQLTSIPELHTDMSLDCLIGYIAMDSLGRTQHTHDMRNRAERTTLDSFKVALRFAYAVTDYDPTLMRSYFYTTNTMNDVYKHARPVSAHTALMNALYHGRKRVGKDYEMLVYPEYIYRIKVTDVVVGYDTLFPMPLHWVNVACRIEEVFKGQRWAGNCQPYQSASQAVAGTDLNPVGKCLIFGLPYKGGTGPLERVSAADTVYNGFFPVPKVDEEYIVFLSEGLLVEGQNTLDPVRVIEATGGLVKIENGIAHDPSNVWGLGTHPSAEALRQRIRERITDIKNWRVR